MGLPAVDRRLLPLKAHYFLFCAGLSPVVPFLSLFARQRGLSEVQVALLFGILPCAGLVAKPAYGALSDWLGRRRLVLVLVLVLTAACSLGLVLFPDSGHRGEGSATALAEVTACSRTNVSGQTGSVWLCRQDAGAADEKRCPREVSLATGSPCRVECPEADWLSRVHGVDVALNDTCSRFRVSWMLGGTLPPAARNHTAYDGPEEEVCVPLGCRLVDCPQEVVWSVPEDTQGQAARGGGASSWLFWTLGALMMAGSAHGLASMSLSDALCYSALGPSKRLLFGQQRLWGTVGWGIFSFLGGVMVDQLGGGQDYSPCFYLGAALSLLATLATCRIHPLQEAQQAEEEEKAQDAAAPSPGMWAVLLRPSAILFLLWCVLFGMAQGLLIHFHFWYLEDLAANDGGCKGMESMKLLQGIILGLRCFAAELPFMIAAGWLLVRLGVSRCLSLGLLANGVRYVLYWAVPYPWWALPLELLHGLAFALPIVGLTSHASAIAPRGAEATMQGTAGACWDSLGLGMGALLGGLLFRQVGGARTFLLFGLVLSAAAVLHFLASCLMDRSRLRRTHPESEAPKAESASQESRL